MDTQFMWQESFNIGVDLIDKEHQKLFRIINKLFKFKEKENSNQWACQEGIKFFKKHTMTHFADEEAYMASIQYEGLRQHALLHKGFRENTLPALENELEQTNYSPDAVEHFLGVCAGWLIGHTLTEDLAITGRQTSKWKKILPGEDLAAIKKIIIQLLFDMFHLDSHLISDAYHGEKFGNGVYYRLIYGTKQDKKKQEVVLVFEEKLLINTVGKIMGIQAKKLDNMLLQAVRYTARQFISRVMEQLPGMESYELENENFLSYEQFQKVFEKENFQISLLFNTGEGYFSYCTIAPHLLENGIGSSIVADNAIDKIETYLANRESQKKQEVKHPKQKILVVDDSKMIRESMNQLLNKDYEISLAESGIAAIRTITLNRPDLILLDYEMPVCDGRQTLEMIRSDQAFTNLPVIFLTGRRDPESIKKVVPLKPAGYLLKNSKPDDIKKEIDAFLKKQRAKGES